MKVNSIINRYIFKEITIPFAICLAFFTLLFLLGEMLKIIEFIVNYNVSIFTVTKLLFFSIPHFLLFVIPMSIMLSILLAFMRLTGDNEITAIKSGGVSIYKLLPPVLLFCFMGWILTLYISIHGIPKGQRAARELILNSIASNIGAGLKDKERTFNGDFKGVIIYINKIEPKNKELIDVFIEDHRFEDLSYIVTAPTGRFLSDTENLKLQLKLYDGFINYVDIEGRTGPGEFESFDIVFDLKGNILKKRIRKYDKEVSLKKLKRIIKKRAKKKDQKWNRARVKYHQIFSIPFACLTLGLLAMPLGIQSRSAKKSAGLVMGLILFLMYYLMLSAGMAFGESGDLPPSIGMWMPNIIMGGVGIYLLILTAREKTVNIYFIGSWARWFKERAINRWKNL